MYIAQVYNTLHDWWRYLVGTLIVIVGVILGQIPYTIAVMYKVFEQGGDMMSISEEEMMSALEPNLNLLLMLLSFAIGLLVLIFVAKALHQQSFRLLTTARDKIDWSRFWFAFLFWGIISAGLIFLDYYMSPEDYVWNFKLQPFLILCVIAIVLVPFQTSFEEYFFRGYLMQGIGVLAKNKWLPLLITSVTFGLLHIANPEIDKLGHILLVYYIGTGFFLGIMTLMDDGLELALGFHAANNLFTAVLVTADWTAFQTHSLFKDMSQPEAAGFMDIFLPVFVLFPIVLFVFARKYKWTNWKERLFGEVVEPPKEDYKIIGETED